MKNLVYLALGSNIGDRMTYLQEAERQLREHAQIRIVKCSKIYETEHWPRLEKSIHPPHLNQVIAIETNLSPSDLLQFTQAIEILLGKKKREHWGSREIDIDILLYQDLRSDSPTLTLPHPRINERKFVLIPLLEIAPDLLDPLSQRLYSDILREMKDDHVVCIFH